MHDHVIDGMLQFDRKGLTPRSLRLHLDNSHDARTSGWDFDALDRLHHKLHASEADRLVEIEAAANLIAERLAAAKPAVVESVLGPVINDETLTEWERQVHAESAAYVTVHLAPKLIAALRASRAEVERLRERMTEWATAMRSHRETYGLVPSRVWVDAGDFLRLESATPYVEPEWMRQETDAIARGAELARAFNVAGRALKMSGDPASPDTAGGVGALPGAGTPGRPFEDEDEAALEASLAAAKAKRR